MARLTSPPPGISKLNDSVYELKHCENPDVEVIFFHGLQPLSYEDAYWRTWLSRDGTVVWPQTWLAEDLPNARILSISYNSVAARVRGSSSGHMDPVLIIENLIQDIVQNSRWAGGKNCPVVLVGHSLGGMIIKKFILRLRELDDDCAKTFLSNCSGAFFYSTPHGGSELTHFTKYLAWSRCVIFNDAVLDLLRVLGQEPARINDEFSRVRRRLNIETASIFETCKTRVGIFSMMVVTEAANRVDLETSNVYSAEANHYDVCKPTNKENDNIFYLLVNFVKTCRDRKMSDSLR